MSQSASGTIFRVIGGHWNAGTTFEEWYQNCQNKYPTLSVFLKQIKTSEFFFYKSAKKFKNQKYRKKVLIFVKAFKKIFISRPSPFTIRYRYTRKRSIFLTVCRVQLFREFELLYLIHLSLDTPLFPPTADGTGTVLFSGDCVYS